MRSFHLYRVHLLLRGVHSVREELHFSPTQCAKSFRSSGSSGGSVDLLVVWDLSGGVSVGRVCGVGVFGVGECVGDSSVCVGVRSAGVLRGGEE